MCKIEWALRSNPIRCEMAKTSFIRSPMGLKRSLGSVIQPEFVAFFRSETAFTCDKRAFWTKSSHLNEKTSFLELNG